MGAMSFLIGAKSAIEKSAALKPGVKLQPHQLDAVKRSARVGGMAMNWGLGSGKTLGSIAIAEERGGNVLVVTPASLRTNFDKQMREFVTDDRIGAYTIVSYAKFRKDPEGWVQRTQPNTLIADEFHRLRNSNPRKPFEKIRKRVPFMVGLTGSLINNRPEEIVPLVNLTSGERVFESQEQFKRDHLGEKKVSPGFWGKVKGVKPGVVEVVKNEKLLGKRLAPHVHRFTGSAEYKKHVPTVVEEKVVVHMTPSQEKLYKAVAATDPELAYKMRKNLPPSKKELQNMNAFMTAARQIMNNPREYAESGPRGPVGSSPKFQAQIRDLVRMSKADPNFRAVVYSNFLAGGLEPVITALNKKGVKAKSFTGKLNDKERKALVEDLNAGRVKILGLSPAGGEGLDLKGVKVVQLTEEHWNPERARQAIGRSARYKSHAHLPEAERKVIVRRYLAGHKPTLANRLLRTQVDMSPDQWIDKRRQEKLELNQQLMRTIREAGS